MAVHVLCQHHLIDTILSFSCDGAESDVDDDNSNNNNNNKMDGAEDSDVVDYDYGEEEGEEEDEGMDGQVVEDEEEQQQDCQVKICSFRLFYLTQAYIPLSFLLGFILFYFDLV